MLAAAFREHSSLTVTYQRGSDSVSLNATVGKSSGFVNREYGARERWDTRDYLVAVADLVIAGERVEPQDGDRIIEIMLDEDDVPVATVTYEVLPPEDDNEPSWRMSDRHALRYRIHTKEHSRDPLP